MGGILACFDETGAARTAVAAMQGSDLDRGAASAVDDGPFVAAAFRHAHEEEPIAQSGGVCAAVHGYLFHSGSKPSARVLLDGYLEGGEGSLCRADGEFAFILWDSRAKILYIGRDSFGARPLYYAHSGGCIVIASEIRQLLRSNVVEARVDRRALAAEFGQERRVPGQTLFSGVFRVPPSQLRRFSFPARPAIAVTTWAPPTRTDSRRTERDVVRELPALLGRCIARRRWRRPILTLSGGYDSTAIASVVGADPSLYGRLAVAGRPCAVTLSFPGDESDETEASCLVARHTRFQQAVIDATGTGPVGTAEQLGERCDQPYGGTGYQLLLLIREARRRGHETLVTGSGAEHFWESTPELAADLLWKGRLGQLSRQLWERSANTGGLARALWRDAIRPLISERLVRCDARSFDAISWGRKAAAMNAAPWVSVLEVIEQICAREGIEVSHPFLDREMAEYAFTTPPHLVGTAKCRKRLFALAFRPLLPEGFWKISRKVTRDGLVARDLADPAPLRLGPIREWRLPSLVSLNERERRRLELFEARQPVDYPALLWKLISMELWLRRYFPAEPVQGLEVT